VLINERQKNLGGGSLERTKKVCNEALIGVQVLPGLCMNLLKKGHHVSCQKMDVVFVGGPQNNPIKFFFKVTNLHHCFGLADVKHLSHQNQSTVNLNARDLINERKVVLVGKERFVGEGGEMILQDMQDQLVDYAKLNHVSADKPLVVVFIAIKSNHLAFCGVLSESIGQ
jgi:hypothetical protein